MLKLTLEQQINFIVLQSQAEHNRVFIAQTIRDWDEDGSGLFAKYIRTRVALKWQDFVSRN